MGHPRSSAVLVATVALLSVFSTRVLASSPTGRSRAANFTHRHTYARHCARTASFHRAACRRGRPRRSPRSRHLFFVPRHGRCRDATLTPTARDVEQVRAATLCLVNRERSRHGEAPLHWNDRLIRAAQSHTESMAFGDYFGHVGPGGQTPLTRMRRTGYISSARFGYEVGENIGFGTLWLGTPRAIVAAWMASPGHRANILDRRYRDTGIGVSSHPPSALAHGQAGGIYTQDFGVIIR